MPSSDLRLIVRIISCAAAFFVLEACASESSSPSEPPPAPSPLDPRVAIRLEVVSGGGQWTLEHTALRSPLRVRVLNGRGEPIAAKQILLSVHGGRGTLADSVAMSDAAGELVVPTWTLGSADDGHQIRVRADSLDMLVAAFAFRAPPAVTGERLLILRDRGVYLTNTTGMLPQFVHLLPDYVFAPVLGPGDTLMTYGRSYEESDSVCVVALWASTRRCVKDERYGNLNAFTWATNPERVVFNGFERQVCGFGLYCGPFVPLTLDIQTMSVVRFTGIAGAVESPTWSRDGRFVAFARNGTLWVTNADGTGARSIAVPAAIYVRRAIWSPNASLLALEVEFTDRCPYNCDTGLAVIGADGSGYRLLADARGLDDEYVRFPLWLPDGSTIAYALERSEIDPNDNNFGVVYAPDLFTVSAAGGAPTLVMPRAIPLSWR